MKKIVSFIVLLVLSLVVSVVNVYAVSSSEIAGYRLVKVSELDNVGFRTTVSNFSNTELLYQFDSFVSDSNSFINVFVNSMSTVPFEDLGVSHEVPKVIDMVDFRSYSYASSPYWSKSYYFASSLSNNFRYKRTPAMYLNNLNTTNTYITLGVTGSNIFPPASSYVPDVLLDNMYIFYEIDNPSNVLDEMFFYDWLDLVGNEMGYRSGWDKGFEDGFINGRYNYGYELEDGSWVSAEIWGALQYSKGQSVDFNFFDGILNMIFSSFTMIASIEILPNFTLGYIIGIILMFGLVAFIVGKGGKK